MDDPKWLRLITIGLVLAAVAVGYFLFTGRFSSKVLQTTQISQASPGATSSAQPSVLGQNNQGFVSPSTTPVSAFNKIPERTAKGGQSVDALPRTGFPGSLVTLLAISTMIAGWGLRRFPR